MSEILAHRSRALSPEETEELLRDRLGDGVQRSVVAAGVFTLWIEPSAWVEAATRCRDERLLAYDLFDSLFGVDAREDGFDVVAVLYSTSTGNRIALRARCEGGREAPSLPSLTEVYRGANWMERETYDMFGIEFAGHPGLEPRILTVENFEGWPLRKDFHLAARVAKPWPGVAEPVELDEDGNVIERVTGLGDAPGPYELDKAMAAQAKQVNAPPAAPETAAPDDGAADAAADGASAEVTASATASGATVASDAPVDEDRAARAKAKAEERRRKQAEARKAKAQARAARAAGEDAPAAAEDTPATTDDAPEAGAPTEDATAATGDAPDDVAASADPKAKAEERRRKQAEARKARAAARAAKVSGADEPAAEAGSATDAPPADGDPAASAAGDAPDGDADPASDAAAHPASAEAPDAAEAPAGDATSEPSTSAPEDDRAARAKAKAEERRRKQAELRAARAKAREERAEQTGDGEDDA